METYYTIKEVAEKFGVTVQTIHRFTRSGELRTIKFGGSTRIAESDLKAFIEKGKK